MKMQGHGIMMKVERTSHSKQHRPRLTHIIISMDEQHGEREHSEKDIQTIKRINC